MADIQINELLESTTAANSDWIAIDNGSATKKISVENFNATGAASAAQSAAAAAQSASAALAAQTAAEQAEDDAQALITSAQTIVSDAQTYANEAATSANTASTAANTATAQSAIATQAATQAGTYAQNVDSFAKTAKSWAVGGTGTRQGEDTDNSKYYSQQAHDSEINAAASETAAATSETNAATSETNAAASESNAATSETNAAQSESNASASATSAASSAASALTSANNAATSESNAAASETNADLSSEDSEAWSVGQRNGVDVPPSDPTYHNNAKYWADVASGGVSGVSSFNGRSGIVVPALGDYAANIVEFDNTSSSLQSTTTQAAIEEVQGNVGDVASDLSTLDGSLKPVAKSGAYNDLTGKPTLGSAAAKNSTNAVSPGSTDLVESGAVYTELSSEASARANADNVFTAEIADMNNVLGAKNLLPNNATTQTIDGVTFTVNDDGSITASGTSTNPNYSALDISKTADIENSLIIGKKCIISKAIDNSCYFNVRCRDSSNQTITQWAITSQDLEVTIPQETKYLLVYLIIVNNTTVNHTFYPMIRPASIQDDTYVPYSMTNQQITPYVQAISNPNLLDNPWFTVNQRGQSTYSVTGAVDTYTVDRWSMLGWSGKTVTLNVGSDGIEFTAGVNSFRQKLYDIWEALVGKTVTLSIEYTSADASGQIGIIISDSWDANTVIRFKAGHNLDSITFVVKSGTDPKLWTYIPETNTSVKIKAVKLELGPVSTLAMDTAPNYATELLKCQRYFQRFKPDTNSFVSFGKGFAITTTDLRIELNLMANMRSEPAISYSNLADFVYTSSIASQGASPTAIGGAGGRFGNQIAVKFTGTFTSSSVYEIYVNNGGYLDFSADL